MTHSSHSYGFRLGITKDWKANWFSKNKDTYRKLLMEDFYIRSFLEKELEGKMVGDISINRKADDIDIVIKTARPGLIIGKDGGDIEILLNKLKTFARRKKINNNFNTRVEEIRYVEQDATLIAESIVESLKKRMHYRRVIKSMVEKVMANRSVSGCRILISGRLNGNEMANTDEEKRGRIPLQTIRADIDYSHKNAIMPYGVLGVKVWIYKGDIEQNKK